MSECTKCRYQAVSKQNPRAADPSLHTNIHTLILPMLSAVPRAKINLSFTPLSVSLFVSTVQVTIEQWKKMLKSM